MILVDTAIWVDHLRRTDEMLASLLSGKPVLTHPLIIGELALGTLRRREALLRDLRATLRNKCFNG